MLSGVIKLIQVFNFSQETIRERKLCVCQGPDTQECEERHR